MAVVQYTFTHKQYIEQHSSLIRKSADRAPSLRGIPWHLPYNWREKHGKKPQSGWPENKNTIRSYQYYTLRVQCIDQMYKHFFKKEKQMHLSVRTYVRRRLLRHKITLTHSSAFLSLFNTLRTGSFKMFKRPFPGFLTILTL